MGRAGNCEQVQATDAFGLGGCQMHRENGGYDEYLQADEHTLE